MAVAWCSVIGEPPQGSAEVPTNHGGVCAHGGLRSLSSPRHPFLLSSNGHTPNSLPYQREDIAMHFSLTAQYTPQALNNIMENPTTNRYEAAKNLIEAAGGKLISMYSTAADGPGVLVIFDVPDPSAAPAISGVVVSAGVIREPKLTRLFTQDEIKQVRQKASQLRG